MGTFLVIILESAICLALFYLLYKLALSKDTFHRFNRVVLLSMLLLSAVIPVCAILLESAFRPQVQLATIVTGVQVVGVVPVTPIETPSKSFPLALALMMSVYAAGVLFFSGRLLRNWIVLTSLIRKCTVEKLDGRIHLFTHHLPIAPFSWMRSIVVSSKDLNDNKDIILTHELAHIRLGHSWDLLATDLCILVQWFNPAAWLLRQELQAVHEFEADDKVLRKGIDAKKYQLLIIEKAVGTRLYSMANSFNHGSLKKRITMMLKEKSSPWARAKYAVVLPLAAIALMGFARPEFTTLQARSAGEIDQLLSWTDVPAPAGPSSNPSPSSSQSSSSSQSPQDKSSGNSEKSATIGDKKSSDPKPLIVLDGVLIQPNVVSGLNFRTATDDEFAKVLNLSPSDIKDISVLKGEAAVSLYGEKGRNGVIVITTKAQSAPVVDNLQVSGQVVNASSNSPVVGANIAEINTENRILSMTITDLDGRFSLTVKSSDNKLRVSHVSYERVNAPIQKEMTVTLTQKKLMLNETVVMGIQKTESSPVKDAPQKVPVYGVEQMPQYPGGDEALKKYIKDNLRYPQSAVNKGFQGKVICSFIVDENGNVTDIKVMSGVDPALDAEAVRVVSGMPTWIPGKQNGKDCAVQYALPIIFSMKKN